MPISSSRNVYLIVAVFAGVIGITCSVLAYLRDPKFGYFTSAMAIVMAFSLYLRSRPAYPQQKDDISHQPSKNIQARSEIPVIFLALLSIMILLFIISQYFTFPGISYFGLSPKFENLSVTPKEIDFVSIEARGKFEGNTIKPNRFDYSVESSSNNVVLFVIPPNGDEELGPIRPNLIQLTAHGLYRLEWKNITLNIDDIGEGKYRFIADGYYKSPPKLGPKITTFILTANYRFHNVTSQSYDCTFNVILNGHEDRIINAEVSLNNASWFVLGDTQTYKANSGPKELIWDYHFTISSIQPRYFRFLLD